MKSESELLPLLAQCPPVGSRWKHFKGATYVIMAASLRESDLLPMVTYRNIDGTCVFSRTLSTWLETVTLPNGGSCPRYTPLSDTLAAETPTR